MKFQFNADKANYEHFAAGRVLLSQAGTTAFPVRLASEIFQEAYTLLGKKRLRVYDPCCGTGYLLTSLAFLHHEQIAALYGSDIAFSALKLAESNLGLLQAEGLERRRAALQNLYALYGKVSHAEALQSCEYLHECLPKAALETALWLGDATRSSFAPESVDLLICDVPYGEKVAWESQATEPLYALLEAQAAILAPKALVVIISDKGQKAAHPNYRRYKQANHGKRRITILSKEGKA